MFDNKDRDFFHKSVDKLSETGDKVGEVIHKHSKKFIAGAVILGILSFFGIFIFLGSMLSKSFGKKD